MNPIGKRLPAFLMLAIMVSMPITVLAYGLDDDWSPLRRGAIEPEGWRGGPLEDLIQDTMEGDDSLLRMLDHIGAMPAQVPVQSHILGAAVPPQALPGLYEAEALSSSTPLRTAVLAYNVGLELMDADELLASPDLSMADDLPFDAQVAIAVLLYAITDASLLQKQAVSGLSDEDYTALMGLPGMILSGRLDPTDGSEAADEDFAQAYGLLSQVDKQRIDEAALIMVHSVSHAMPSLRDWAQREREQAQNPDARVTEIGSLLDQYTPARIDEMDPIQRLDILADTLRMASGFQGVEVSPYLRPLPAPEGDSPLRDAILDLAGVLEAAGLPLGDLVEESQLQRADSLPRGMQVAVARIVTNQAAVVQASLDLGKAVETAVSSVDPEVLADPEALTDPEALPDISASQREAILSVLGDLRHAEIRTVLAVQQGAPTLEAWGLHWAREPSMLPATPAHAPGKLTDAAAMAGAMADPATSLQEVMRLAGQARGIHPDVVEAPLPPRGSLADSVLELYDRLGVEATPQQRDDIRQGALSLHPVVEQNTARILVAQLDALDSLAELEASLSVEDRLAMSRGAAALERLRAGEVSLRDVQDIRAHYEVRDRIESTFLEAAAGVAAAMDAANQEVGDYADGITGYKPPQETPKSKPWYARAWSAVSSIQVIGTASAQSAPMDPVHIPAVCPSSPLAVCEKDIWFMDPLLETIVVSGFGETRFDPREMGKDWTRPDLPEEEDRDPEFAAAVELGGQVLTVDLGGDDIYRNNAGGALPAMVRAEAVRVVPGAAAVALDLGGNDRYLPAPAGFSYEAAQGAAVDGIGILYDRRGEDHYEATQQAQGFAGGDFAVGVLLDGDGDDTYLADDAAQGAAQSGLGILVDRAGDDRYTLGGDATTPATGHRGATGGIGIFVDATGDDTYQGGMQGQGSGGGVGVFVDLEGSDAHSRTHPDDSKFGNGECWTSLRAPPRDPFDDTNRSAGTMTDFVGQAPQGAGNEEPQDYVNRTSESATRNGTRLAGAASDDAAMLASNVTQGHGLFLDLAEDGCTYDPSDLLPADAGDVDPNEPFQTLTDVVEDVTNDQNGFLLDVGFLRIGDAGNTTYDDVSTSFPFTLHIVLDLGGHNTYNGRTSGSKLLVNFDPQGNDQYLAPGEDCVQGCDAMLIDLGGDDHYIANQLAQGVSPNGDSRGVLFDAGGNDTFVIERREAGTVAQGGVAGSSLTKTGSGILLDVDGDDEYRSPSQGILNAPPSAPAWVLFPATALFVDFSGNDAYSPVGDQGAGVDGTGLATFVDGGGDDTYVGTVGNPAAPDLSHQRNGRIRATAPTSDLTSTPAPTNSRPFSIFWDVNRGEAPEPGGLLDGDLQGFQLGLLEFAVGTTADEIWESDYTLLVDPGGDDTYRNNAGGTVLRSDGNGYPLAALLIDLDGNDRYEPQESTSAYDDSLAQPIRTPGVLTQGAGFLGTGILADEAGREISDGENPEGEEARADDAYVARAMSQGFGLFGWGILWDRQGDDLYRYDPAVVKRPVIDGNLVAWLQAAAVQPSLPGGFPGSGGLPDVSARVWEARLRDAGWASDCRINVAGEPGPFQGLEISRTDDWDRLALSAFDGLWRVYHARGDVSGAGCSGIGSGQAMRQAASVGSENVPSNQINPQFISILTDSDILWQDDRDGTWSLYFKRTADAPTAAARPLVNTEGLLGQHDPRSSNQTSPHVHGSWIIYQDDRFAGNQCPAGTWSIHRYNVASGQEELLSPSPENGGCALHAKPRISLGRSNEFAVWQTLPLDAQWQANGTWDVAVYHIPSGDFRVVTDGMDGDQYDPVVADGRILYTSKGSEGGPDVIQYVWHVDESQDLHRLERRGALHPALDTRAPHRAAWVDTTGHAGSSGDPVGSLYWEIHRKDLPVVPSPGEAGQRQSAADGFESLWLQGASYAGGRGILVDEGGRETYLGDRFAQGAAASITGPGDDFDPPEASLNLREWDAHGALVDAAGNDAYQARGESQGVHFARGVVVPADLTQFGAPPPILYAEAASAMGLLFDLRGNDGYDANRHAQGYGALTHGAGTTVGPCMNPAEPSPGCPPARAFAGNSYGFFMDLGGSDAYHYPPPLDLQTPIQDDPCGAGDDGSGLHEIVQGLLDSLIAQCKELDGQTGGQRPGGSGERNNEVWQQKPRDIRLTGGCLVPDEPLCPAPVVVGGVGMDLPLMDRLNGALEQIADEMIDAFVEVTAVGEDGIVQGKNLRGAVNLMANATFKHNNLELEFDSAEFFIDSGTGPEFLGPELLRKDLEGPRELFIRPWATDSEAFPDGGYKVTVRVHYKHSESGFTLGYAETSEDFTVDNPPRILGVEGVPLVSDSQTNPPVTLSAFSPFPYRDDAPGHPQIAFRVSSHVGSAGHDGWARVDVLDTNENVVATIFDDVVHASTPVTGQVWDGTSDATGEPVAAGAYRILARATDREPDEQWSDESRVSSEESWVVVYPNTPHTACASIPGQDCNDGALLNRQAHGADFVTSDTLRVPLQLGARTDSGDAPTGLEQVRRFHVRLGQENDLGIEWQDPLTLASGQTMYPLMIREMQKVHVLVLAEDMAGNLECSAACGLPTSSSVERGDDEAKTALKEAFDRKLQLQWNGMDATFPEWSSEEGQPVYATFTADLQSPAIRSPLVLVDGRAPNALMPRVGTRSDVVIQLQVDEEQLEPIAIFDWGHGQDPARDEIHRSDIPTHPVTVAIDERHQQEHPGARPRYNATWRGWSDLVGVDAEGPTSWPEGFVSLRLDAEDRAGNMVRQRDQPRIELLLDRTRPEIENVEVLYPDGRLYAERGDDVRVIVRASDPDILGFETPSRDLQLKIHDASSVTGAAEEEDSCTLAFKPGLCFQSQLKAWETMVPIDGTAWQGDENLRAGRYEVIINVTDVAGNTNQTIVELILGAPMLEPERVSQEVGVYNATTGWTTASETDAYLLYGEGSKASDLKHRINTTATGTEHEFSIEGLQPGRVYVYRFFAVDPGSEATEAGPLTLFNTLHGVDMELHAPHPDAPAAKQVISGLYTVKGNGWVQSALDSENITIEPRVILRMWGPGLPDAGRVVFDGFTTTGSFEMDLVTDALEDGTHTLEATVSYLGEEKTTIVDDLVVDNSAPLVRFARPIDEAILRERPDRLLVRVGDQLTAIDIDSVQVHVNGNRRSVDMTFHPDGDGQSGVLEITGLPSIMAGIVRLEVLAQDMAGNHGYASIRVLYDPDAPEAETQVLYPDGQRATRPGQWITIKVGQAADTAGIVRVTADAGGLGGGSGIEFVSDGGHFALELMVPASQPEGTYGVPVRVHDAAGNVQALMINVVVDATRPAEPVVHFQPTGGGSAEIHVQASEAVSVALEAVSHGFESVRAVASEFAISHVLQIEGLQAGIEYDVELRVHDRAGNEVVQKREWSFLPELGDVPSVHGLTATATPKQVRLAWDHVGDGFRYAVHRADDGMFETVGVVNQATYKEDVEPADYRYFVQALDPHGRHGAPSGVVDVHVPQPDMDDEATAVSVHPKTGVAGATKFVFQARLQGAREADPSVWLVLDEESRRMTKDGGNDCRSSCTFRHVTVLPELDLHRPAIEYHVEVFDAAGATRMPQAGSLPGPTVLVHHGLDAAAEKEAWGTSILLVLAALATALVIRRREFQ